MALTAVQVKQAKPKCKPYKLADGAGLYLLVHPNGGKYWRLKYRYLGKEKTLAFGTAQNLSLAEARDLRANAKKQLAHGIDPNEKKREDSARAKADSENSFKAVALEWHEHMRPRWSEGHADKGDMLESGVRGSLN
ncbi:tyrosine-type recombinase/integrase [Salinisphaera hydrothermalis]|uniref:Integrase family protein n=1 Tax=Salinisphaera hydrothermalis (strain C41B8) TaxID=1304275 RepID=A0A084IFW8_SALHC|nr:Arm DNA-binding domain-containing protein [Salinisphaera hydrothermalis]KEZ75602.1 integrase family protein [Salinisphaera hydrothermalis C41B8]